MTARHAASTARRSLGKARERAATSTTRASYPRANRTPAVTVELADDVPEPEQLTTQNLASGGQGERVDGSMDALNR
jgi:hypothetical protein